MIPHSEVEYPITRASLNLTRNCNLRCTYPCFTNGCVIGSMSWEIAKRAVDFLFKEADRCQGADRAVEISFWGGEPLLEWELLKQIAIYAKDRSSTTGIPVSFGGTTNGVLLTPEKFDFLDEYKIFFMISFDGTPETHDYHRRFRDGKGSHKVVEDNLKSALARWPFYRVRLSPFAERIDHFFEDIKYIFDLGCNYIMFSPVYESNFTDEHWKIWEEECYRVVDYMKQLRQAGRNVEIEHFKTYTGPDNSRWPCGAGRHYLHINHEGYIFSCHRSEKFDDPRPYLEQELCLGHIDMGITKPQVRQQFIDFQPKCKGNECWGTSPCWGGCYAINWDFLRDITKPYEGICKYVEMQKKVSQYYRQVLGPDMSYSTGTGSCICNNMCYSEGTPQEIKIISTQSPISCLCYNTSYTGPLDTSLGRPLTPMVNNYQVDLNMQILVLATLVKELIGRVDKLEKNNG